jgi:hypothetical protein
LMWLQKEHGSQPVAHALHITGLGERQRGFCNE